MTAFKLRDDFSKYENMDNTQVYITLVYESAVHSKTICNANMFGRSLIAGMAFPACYKLLKINRPDGI